MLRVFSKHDSNFESYSLYRFNSQLMSELVLQRFIEKYTF